MSASVARNYLNAVTASMSGPNVVLDLRIPRANDYQFGVLDGELTAYAGGQQDERTTMANINAGWNAITTSEGRVKQLAAYLASLNLKQ